MGKVLRRRDETLTCSAEPPVNNSKEVYSQEAVLRSEAEAPFRVFRIAIYAALAVSAGLGGLIATVRVIAGFAKGDIGFTHVLASEDVRGLGIDLASLSILISLYRTESGAREQQIKRLQRETTLSQLKVSGGFSQSPVIQLVCPDKNRSH